MLKVASVGLDWWSDELAKAIQGSSDKLRIVAGVARRAAKRVAFAERFGVHGVAVMEAMARSAAQGSVGRYSATSAQARERQHATFAPAGQ